MYDTDVEPQQFMQFHHNEAKTLRNPSMNLQALTSLDDRKDPGTSLLGLNLLSRD